MEKRLYYQLTDQYEMDVTADLNSCMTIIEGHMWDYTNGVDQNEFTLTPVWLTDEEYSAMPESESY